MKHHLRLLLAVGFAAMSMGASAAAVHDWTATRIGAFDATFPLGVSGMNNAGQVIVFAHNFRDIPAGGDYGPSFLYSPGSPGQLVQLGPSTGALTSAAALNASGQVVGWSSSGNSPRQAFLYQNGRTQPLGLPGDIGAEPTDINDRGQVTLNSIGADHVVRGAIVNPGGSTTVLSIPASGINNRGQVFSHTHTPSTGSRGFLYDNGQITDLGSLGGQTVPLDMNESGQIVGNSEDAGGRQHPFLYADGRMTEIAGATGFGSAWGINDRGQVVGSVDGRGFLYSNGQVQLFGDGSTFPEHINELGMVVGTELPTEGTARAFFYSDDGRITDLSQWIMNSFDDVTGVSAGNIGLNDLGQIAIGAALTNGQQTLFVLTPIPEPSTYALMLAGLGTLAWIARRQRAANARSDERGALSAPSKRLGLA